MARRNNLRIKTLLSIVLIVTLISIGLAIPYRIHASTVTVNSLLDDGTGCTIAKCTFRDGIAAAAPNDTLVFASGLSGTILLNGTQITFDKNITINEPGASSLTISGNNASRIGYINSGARVTLSGVTVSNGKIVPDSVGCTICGLGGAFWVAGTLLLDNNVLSNNTATNGGGALFVYAAGTTRITNSTFANNNTDGNGGAISGMVTIIDSTFANNHASSAGGAVCCSINGITRSTFIGNTAGDGGAIYGGGDTQNSTFYGNAATNNGGALYNGSGVINLKNSTLVGNTANKGGAIYNTNAVTSTVNLASSIVAGNSLTGVNGVGPDIDNLSDFVSTGHNLIGDGSAINGLFDPSDQVGSTASPLNPQVAPLALNAPGTTKTMALLPGSPAIGKGQCDAPTTTDQRGVGRKLPCDIGAYETPAVPTPTPTVTPSPAPVGDTIGYYLNGTFYLRNSNSSGQADLVIAFGSSNSLPIVGDWNGDGIDTIGVYISALGVFLLRDSNAPGQADYAFVMGNPGDEPLAGKWDATMSVSGIGVYRPTNGLLFAKRSLLTGYADYTMVLGNPGDHGIAGDWDGNGYDSIGVYRPNATRFYLANLMGGTTDLPAIIFDNYNFLAGPAELLPIAGDWTASGVSHVGYFLNGVFYLKNTFTDTAVDNSFVFGAPGALPVAGKWVLHNQPLVRSAINVLIPVATPTSPTRTPQLTAAPNSDGQFD